MPPYKIPADCCLLLDSDAASVEGDNDKTDLASVRSSSPKSASSSTCADDISSIVSASDASERSAALLLLDLSEEEEHQVGTTAAAVSPTSGGCESGLGGLEEDLESSLGLAEDRAEELMAQGADMRHVLRTSWKLQPKMTVGMRLKKGGASALSGGGRAGQQALRDAASAQRKAIVQVKIRRVFFFKFLKFLKVHCCQGFNMKKTFNLEVAAL